MSTTTALVAEDNIRLAEATKNHLESSDCPVDYANAVLFPKEAEDQLSHHDVLIIDIRFADRPGDGISLIQKAPSDTPVVAYSVSRRHRHVRAADAVGADAYVWKNEKNEDGIIEAVENVLDGETYISEGIENKESFDEDFSIGDLRESYQDAIRAISRSSTAAEAAEKINVTPETMYAYRTEIANRLGLEGARELDDVARLLS